MFNLKLLDMHPAPPTHTVSVNKLDRECKVIPKETDGRGRKRLTFMDTQRKIQKRTDTQRWIQRDSRGQQYLALGENIQTEKVTQQSTEVNTQRQTETEKQRTD